MKTHLELLRETLDLLGVAYKVEEETTVVNGEPTGRQFLTFDGSATMIHFEEGECQGQITTLPIESQLVREVVKMMCHSKPFTLSYSKNREAILTKDDHTSVYQNGRFSNFIKDSTISILETLEVHDGWHHTTGMEYYSSEEKATTALQEKLKDTPNVEWDKSTFARIRENGILKKFYRIYPTKVF